MHRGHVEGLQPAPWTCLGGTHDGKAPRAPTSKRWHWPWAGRVGLAAALVAPILVIKHLP
jgi:hypothetical protein